MRVGVIGGSGFIGRNLVDKLKEKGHEVTIFDIMAPARKDVRHIYIDVVELSKVVVALTGHYDALFNLAAMADVNDVYTSPVEAGHVNIMATANVLEAARRNRIPHVIHASTVWVYDLSDQKEVDEDTPLSIERTGHVYTATKVAAESYCWAFSKLYGVNTTILRYGVPYGPFARGATVLARFVERALNNQPLTITGSGKAFRNFVYVEDLADGNVAALSEKARNRVFNLEGSTPVTVLELAHAVKRIVRDVPIEMKEAREGDISGRKVSAQRAYQELGWKPKVDIEEGIRRYLKWYQSNPEG